MSSVGKRRGLEAVDCVKAGMALSRWQRFSLAWVAMAEA